MIHIIKKKRRNFFSLYGPDGQEIDRAYNLITTEGKNYALDGVFAGGATVTPWYIGLVAASPSFAVGDTLASHVGWTELTDLSAARVAWDEAAAAAGSMGTTTKSVFTATAAISIKGAFLCNVISGTAGILMATASFSTQYDLANTETFATGYTIQGF